MTHCRAFDASSSFPLHTHNHGSTLSDSTALPLATLAARQMSLLTRHNLGSLLHDLLALGEDHLDVAGVGHYTNESALSLTKSRTSKCGSHTVWVDTTVSTVRASPLLGSLVDLDVLDDQVAGIQTLGVGIGLGVLEQAEQELGGLDGPAGFGDTELLSLIHI